MTKSDVLQRTCGCENTPSQDDRLTWRHLLAVDPGCRFLTTAFNSCLQYRAFSDPWHQSRMIPVPKKGNLDETTCWRPSLLLEMTGKLHSGVLASCLQIWLLEHNILNRMQRVFLKKMMSSAITSEPLQSWRGSDVIAVLCAAPAISLTERPPPSVSLFATNVVRWGDGTLWRRTIVAVFSSPPPFPMQW